MKTLVILIVSTAVLILAVLIITPAEARKRTYSLDTGCNVTMPCEGGFYSKNALRFMRSPFGSPVQSYSPQRPSRYISGKLVCARNVNAALAERGIRGTGSALAHSFDGWGRRSDPTVGAVAVTDRRGGGHVAIVSRVEGSRVWVWNATGSRDGWHEIEYTNRHARYRVAV